MGKIFISIHKPSEIFQDDIFCPIQVGAKNAKQKIAGVELRDDQGDNISEKNPRFCELTAQYWAWKNYDTDFYGFFHYRRYLSFADNKFPESAWGTVEEPFLVESAQAKYGLTGAKIEGLLRKYDLILPAPHDIVKMPDMGRTLREQFSKNKTLNAADLQIMLDVLREKYPDYLPAAEAYLAGRTSYFCNMFIMKKALFQRYNEWLFDILFECEKRIDFSDYSVERIRTPGHLAERLLNIFILHLKETESPKIKELQTVVFMNTDPSLELAPAFSKHNVAIALSSNDFYTPYTGTLIESLRQHASKDQNYDIIIMHKDITPASQKRLLSLISGHSNFSIRFLNLARYEYRFEDIFLRGHFALETWFRLLMPEILQQYDKILYLDSDMVVLDDVAKIYRTKLGKNLLAACKDPDTAGLYNGFESNKKHYMDNVLKIEKPFEYFQAGTILFNLAEFRNQYSTEEIFKFAKAYKWELLDQDVLNYLAQGKVVFIDMAWNVMYDWRGIRRKDIISRAPKYLSDAYDQAHAHPSIIHYAGPDKPWQYPLSDYAEVFWQYARQTSFYEEIIQRMCVGASVKEARILPRAKNKVKRIGGAWARKTKSGALVKSMYKKLRK